MRSIRRGARHRVSLACLGAMILLCAPNGSAQTPQGPPDEPVGEPVRGPLPPSQEPRKSAPRYALWVTTQESWERNPRLREGANDQTSFVDRIGAGTGYTFRGRRGELAFTADGSRLNYHNAELSALSRWTYGGGATGLYNLSPRSSITVTERYTVSDLDPAALLETSGLPVSLVRSRTNIATGDLVVGLTRKTGLGFSVRHYKITFDDDESGTPTFVAGNRLTFEPTLAYQVNRDHALSAGYSYQKSLLEDRGADIQSIFGAWSARLSRRFSSALAAGASRVASRLADETTPDAPPLPAAWRFFGSARLRGDFRRETIEARYIHSVSHAFGFGRERIADIVGAQFTRTLGQKASLSSTASYGRSRALDSDARLEFTTFTVGGGLRYLLSRQFDLSGGYVYARTKPSASGLGGERTTERAFVALSFGRTRE